IADPAMQRKTLREGGTCRVIRPLASLDEAERGQCPRDAGFITGRAVTVRRVREERTRAVEITADLGGHPQTEEPCRLLLGSPQPGGEVACFRVQCPGAIGIALFGGERAGRIQGPGPEQWRDRVRIVRIPEERFEPRAPLRVVAVALPE